MADPITLGLAGFSLAKGLGLFQNKNEFKDLAQQYGLEWTGGEDLTSKQFQEGVKKLMLEIQEKKKTALNSQNALLDNYKQLTDPKSKFYTDIATKLLGAQDQKTASVGTLLGVGLASGVPYQTASKYADQQRKAIEASNRESVNNTMGNLFLQGQAQGMSSLGQYNQLQENEANRMFQSEMYDEQSQQNQQNQWLTMGFGLVGNELGSNKTNTNYRMFNNPNTNYNTSNNPYFKPFWADTGAKVSSAVAGWR